MLSTQSSQEFQDYSGPCEPNWKRFIVEGTEVCLYAIQKPVYFETSEVFCGMIDATLPIINSKQQSEGKGMKWNSSKALRSSEK